MNDSDFLSAVTMNNYVEYNPKFAGVMLDGILEIISDTPDLKDLSRVSSNVEDYIEIKEEHMKDELDKRYLEVMKAVLACVKDVDAKNKNTMKQN